MTELTELTELNVVRHIENHISLLASNGITEDTGNLNAAIEDFLDHLEAVGLVSQSEIFWDFDDGSLTANKFTILIKERADSVNFVEIKAVIVKDGMEFESIE